MGSLAEALTNLEEKRVYELVDQKVNKGEDVLRIISELNEGMINVGKLFSSGSTS